MRKKILEILLGSLKAKIVTSIVAISLVGGAVTVGVIYKNSIDQSTKKEVSLESNLEDISKETKENIDEKEDETLDNSGKATEEKALANESEDQKGTSSNEGGNNEGSAEPSKDSSSSQGVNTNPSNNTNSNNGEVSNRGGSTASANNVGESNSGGSMTPEPPKQNYDEVTMITYQTHTGNLNLTSNPFDKEFDNALTKVSIESNRNDLLNRTCDDLAKEMVSLEDARNMWVGKYVDNKYKVKSLKMYSVNIKSKSVEESTDKYINRIKTSNLFLYSPSSSIYFDKVRHYGNLSDDSIAVIKRVVIEFERI
ncbi:hypothetical protein [Clostridium intestinale]|uniref:hypothetical protein n=1 Tax=Clostridium intestinale TaxID=36845 RepID=UPI0028E58C90|nr:hypothetical protein [Clostridium intestinale]